MIETNVGRQPSRSGQLAFAGGKFQLPRRHMSVALGDEKRVYTIGHSSQPLNRLILLLEKHDIDAVVDIRSYPFSRYAPQFNQPALAEELPRHGIRYVFRGDELGGRPRDNEYYDDEGHVLYWKVADADFFIRGIARLERGIPKYRIALMCSEENPSDCHRRLLIGRVLRERGITICHIRGDGRVQTEAYSEVGPPRPQGEQGRLPLFEHVGESSWRSVRSVSRRNLRPNSSAF
jgi:hypothetical protein